MGGLPVYDYAQLDPHTLARLEGTLRESTTLERVLDWGKSQTPTLSVLEIVTQDEYTHDVVIPWGRGRYLAYDTT